MDDKKFTDIISKVILSFEKSGVQNETLKESIDQLFLLKDVIFLRQAGIEGHKTCMYCKHFENSYCKNISGEKINDSEIEIVGQTPINGRIKLKVNPFWSCSHFKN